MKCTRCSYEAVELMNYYKGDELLAEHKWCLKCVTNHFHWASQFRSGKLDAEGYGFFRPNASPAPMHGKQKEYLERLGERKYDAKADMVERVYPKLDKNDKPLAGCVNINPESAVAQAVSKLESDRKKTYYWDPYFCDGDWW